MTVGIVGLGLIGGSFAKAYHETGARVLAYNRSRDVLDFAMMSGAVDGELTEENISACDLVLITIYPEAAIEYFKRMAGHIGPKPIVLDCCGTKRAVCAECFPVAAEHGVRFLCGHPMAGTHNSASNTRARTCTTARRWSSCRRTETMWSCWSGRRRCWPRRALAGFPSPQPRSTTG